MIREVEFIPVIARTNKVTRAGTIKEDIQDALAKHICKFEFVGGIYTPCDGKYVSELKKCHVDEHAYYAVYSYIKQVASNNGHDVDHSEINAHNFYETYAVHTNDGDRVFMEIYFDRIYRFINGLKLKEA